MTVVSVSRVTNFAEVEATWRDLEQRAAPSFFQSWTWTGCLAAERFPDPILVAATENGRTVALALFNRVRRRIPPAVLYLGETGTTERDCPYIEYNGVLAESGREDELTALCLRKVVFRYDLILSGISEPMQASVSQTASLTLRRQSHTAPFLDLNALRAAGGDFLAGRSANTRQQIRRSDRFYQLQGPIKLETAKSADAAHAMLDEMAALHQSAWKARGRPGSFTHPFFRRFHRALIAEAMPRGEIALLKLSCHEIIIGILYNFVYRGSMLAYQSGFAYSHQQPRAKPGLTCHARAIQFALDQDLEVYDFLAGEDRYKSSLADQSRRLFWLETGPWWSPRILSRTVLQRFR